MPVEISKLFVCKAGLLAIVIALAFSTVLTWIGCVMTPGGMQANSVASFADGALIATIPLHTGILINESFGGKPTGAVYEWAPGDAGFTKIEGTGMPYANGIEVSDDI